MPVSLVPDLNVMNDSNLDRLRRFVSTYWPPNSNAKEFGIEPLSGDAGFRRYYRVSSSDAQEMSAIAVDSPPDKEKNIEYLRINRLLSQLGVRVPAVVAVDFAQGYFLLEDLGASLLQDRLSNAEADKLYGMAMDQLNLIQTQSIQPAFVLDYDERLLLAEMQLFRDWFVGKLLGMEISPEIESELNVLFKYLADSALAQPRVLVHRDYHARNLMCLSDSEIAVIDFQDAVWGPVTYDLVSLAKDCYLRWSPDRLDQFVQASAVQLQERGLIESSEQSQFREWFDLMGLQRHIKVLGIFSRLYLRDGKAGYLQDLPLVIRYVLEVAESRDVTQLFATWMLQELVPECEKQSWYSDWRNAGDHSEVV